MSYSPSSAPHIIVLCAVIVCFLAAGFVDAGYTPAGPCVCGNSCFGQEDVDYSKTKEQSPYKVLEVPDSITAKQVDHIRIYVAPTGDGNYSVDSQIYMKGAGAAIHNYYVQTYMGQGLVMEYGTDGEGNVFTFPIQYLYVDDTGLALYYRCQVENPPTTGHTLDIACPASVRVSDKMRETLKKKASDCGFDITWHRVE